MASLSELQKDKSFRIRLMVACFSVVLLVSAVYIVFSYHLSTNLGIKVENTSLHRQAILLHAEITKDNEIAEERLDSLVKLIYLNTEFKPEKLYVEAYGEGLLWSLNHGISPYILNTLTERINTTTQQMPSVAFQKSKQNQQRIFNGTEALNGEGFIWKTVEGEGRKIIIIKLINISEAALNIIIKQLSIVSAIVLLIAATLTALLSSWMDKRVQSKNDALTRLATYDKLTELPNRLYLINALQKIMPESPNASVLEQRRQSLQKNIQGCLFIIDIDNFKKTNDVFGHSAGDEFLRNIAQRLSVIIDEEGLLARIGGDEFVIWSENMNSKRAMNLAKEIVSICNEPVIINQLAVSTGVSVGISSYPAHASNIDSLILYADMAMHEAKKSHTGWNLFDSQTSEENRQRLRLRGDLTKAFSKQEIHLYYQPKVALHSGKIIGLEALSRWHHPIEGILSPDTFIDIIEKSGRVQEFGRYIVRTAILQLEEWKKQGIYISSAINLSPYNLLDQGLLNFILKQLHHSNISPDMLEIELVESSTSINIEQISDYIRKFKRAGIKFAIDDFGTGMSSLSYINSLEVDLIKIDRSFVDGIEKEPTKQTIIFTTVTLAHSFNAKLLAEGIENEEQAKILMQMGCAYGQGYYYAKPMQAEQMKDLLLSKATLPIAKE